MDIKDLEGAVKLCDANIQCPEKELLTGFQFEENESSTKFRWTIIQTDKHTKIHTL